MSKCNRNSATNFKSSNCLLHVNCNVVRSLIRKNKSFSKTISCQYSGSTKK